jgi:hypothetical protein
MSQDIAPVYGVVSSSDYKFGDARAAEIGIFTTKAQKHEETCIGKSGLSLRGFVPLW